MNRSFQNARAGGNSQPSGSPWAEKFRKFAQEMARFVGSPYAFLLSVLLIAFWAASGPLFHFSDTWQLVINTGTTIVTFLMVFLIQNTQNRDAKAIHLKLDELIKSIEGARNSLVNLEHLSDEELEKLEAEFKKLSRRHPHGEPLVKSDQTFTRISAE